MAKVRKAETKDKFRPALTPEAREMQLISLAMDLAEKKLRDGTASSQLIAEFVKRGSTKAQLEKEKLIQENQMLKAKTEQLQSTKQIEELYANAIVAMQTYSGNGDSND